MISSQARQIATGAGCSSGHNQQDGSNEIFLRV